MYGVYNVVAAVIHASSNKALPSLPKLACWRHGTNIDWFLQFSLYGIKAHLYYI